MPNILARIDPKTTHRENRLYLDYLASASKGLPPFLAGFTGAGSFWKKKQSALDRSPVPRGEEWPGVIDDLKRHSGRMGSGDRVLQKLDAAKRGGVAFVLTGQQPGIFGGSLLTVYKAATAVALSDVLERKLDRPCVPVFWCGADDADFAEIREIQLPTDKLTPVSARLPGEAHEPGMPVGGISISHLETLWEHLTPFVDAFESKNFVRDVVASALARASDHGELASATIVALLGGAIAVVDGRAASLRRYSRRLISRFVEDEGRLKSVVEKEGQRLERSGYHAQLAVGEDSGVFLFEDGRRRSVPPAQRARLVDAVARRVEDCFPGVILRNLIQDHAFRPIAAVLGPAEVAYRSQILPLYAEFGIEAPVAYPRMSATYLPPPLAELVRDAGAERMRALIENPAAFAGWIYERTLEPSAAAAASDLRSAVEKAVTAFSKRAGAHLPPKIWGKIQGRLTEIERRARGIAETVNEGGKAAALERWPFLGDLEALIRPAGKPQERSVSALTPYLFSGADVVGTLVEIAALHVDELMDGKAHHIVYST